MQHHTLIAHQFDQAIRQATLSVRWGVIVGTGIVLVGFTGVWGFSIGMDTVFFMALFLAMIAWFGMPFLFRVNLKKFASFLEEKSSKSPQEPI